MREWNEIDKNNGEVCYKFGSLRGHATAEKHFPKSEKIFTVEGKGEE